MERKIKRVLSILIAAFLVVCPVMEAVAANQYSVETEDVNGKTLLPGDSVSGLTGPVYLGDEWAEVQLTDGTWTNDQDRPYTITLLSDEDGGGFWLKPAGYQVTVTGGTSRLVKEDGSQEGEEAASKASAWYAAGDQVHISADPASDGSVFEHWEADNEGVAFADSYAAETSFTMPEGSVTVTAVFVQPEPQTEAAPETEEIPQTEPPVEEATEAPTEAAAEETYETAAPDQGAIDLMLPETPQEITWDDSITVGGEENAPEDSPAADAGPDIVIGDPAVPETADSEAETVTEDGLFEVTVENGFGSGSFEQMEMVNIAAEVPEGQTFAGWTASSNAVWFADAASAETQFSMPAEDVVVTATFAENEDSLPGGETEEELLPELTVITVLDELGNVLYETTGTVGDEIVVSVDEQLSDGRTFAAWSVPEGFFLLTDLTDPVAKLVVPEAPVTLTATYLEAAAPEENSQTVPTENSTETDTQPTEAPAEEATEAPATEAPTEAGTEELTEAASTEAAESETPATEEPVTEAPVTETPETLPQETEAGTETDVETELETEEVLLDETETEELGETELGANASYPIELSSEDDVTVEGGEVGEDGILTGVAGSRITITATEYDELTLERWEITMTDTEEQVPYTVDEKDPYTATFIMPDGTVYVEPIYEDLIEYEVEVIDGTGSGSYLVGDYVDIEADEPQTGYRFKEWTVLSGDVELDDWNASSTGFTMPEETVQIRAEYELIPYTLTVKNGTGSGTYVMGTKVDLAANYPASGKEFAQWVVNSENASTSAPDRYYSSVTMPAADVTLEATYKDGPSPDYNEIRDIVPGGEYLVGDTITFSAVGNGMGNTNPNPGDYRYRPSGYQIGSVTGNWSNSQYTTSMAINAVGQYTLNVTYSKDVFNGESWVADGTYDTKSVSFYVVNALSVQTGDDSPILPLTLACGLSLAAIVLVFVLRRRTIRG